MIGCCIFLEANRNKHRLAVFFFLFLFCVLFRLPVSLTMRIFHLDYRSTDTPLFTTKIIWKAIDENDERLNIWLDSLNECKKRSNKTVWIDLSLNLTHSHAKRYNNIDKKLSNFFALTQRNNIPSWKCYSVIRFCSWSDSGTRTI